MFIEQGLEPLELMEQCLGYLNLRNNLISSFLMIKYTITTSIYLSRNSAFLTRTCNC